jgi:hypothetical protein
MRDLLITACPTLVNVEKLTLSELQLQYHRLECEVIDQFTDLSETRAKLHEMRCLVHNYSSVLFALCDSFDAGDQAAILLQVRRLSERRAEQRKKAHS